MFIRKSQLFILDIFKWESVNEIRIHFIWINTFNSSDKALNLSIGRIKRSDFSMIVSPNSIDKT